MKCIERVVALTMGVYVGVNGWSSLCGPAMNWPLVQDVTLPSLYDSFRPQRPLSPLTPLRPWQLGRSGY